MVVAPYCLDFQIADADVRVIAPRRVLAALDSMLAHVSRDWSGVSEPLQIDVRSEAEVWQISGTAPKSKKVLSQGSAMPQVAGAVIASMLAELAFHRDLTVWRAAAVERDGQALAMMGDDWESCITLVAHLHTRGWRIVGGDQLLVAKGAPVAIGLKKSLHANSSCLNAFPQWYRPAVEASPWYSTSHMIAFYAIDPTLVGPASPWCEGAPIRALLRIDGHASEHPALEVGDEFTVADGVRRSDLVAAGVEVAMLVMGGFIETTDFLERWFETLPPAT